MFKRLSFQNLPFEPSVNQVLYVESEYNAETNSLILENYNEITNAFMSRGLQFVYMQNNNILDYLTAASATSNIGPSLLFGPEEKYKGYIFHITPFKFDTTIKTRTFWDRLFFKHYNDWSNPDFRKKAFICIADGIRKCLDFKSTLQNNNDDREKDADLKQDSENSRKSSLRYPYQEHTTDTRFAHKVALAKDDDITITMK